MARATAFSGQQFAFQGIGSVTRQKRGLGALTDLPDNLECQEPLCRPVLWQRPLMVCLLAGAAVGFAAGLVADRTEAAASSQPAIANQAIFGLAMVRSKQPAIFGVAEVKAAD